MKENFTEKILYRSELGRELTMGEMDGNFRFVANPWNPERRYASQEIVYELCKTDSGEELRLFMYYNINERGTSLIGIRPSKYKNTKNDMWYCIGGGGSVSPVGDGIIHLHATAVKGKSDIFVDFDESGNEIYVASESGKHIIVDMELDGTMYYEQLVSIFDEPSVNRRTLGFVCYDAISNNSFYYLNVVCTLGGELAVKSSESKKGGDDKPSNLPSEEQMGNEVVITATLKLIEGAKGDKGDKGDPGDSYMGGGVAGEGMLKFDYVGYVDISINANTFVDTESKIEITFSNKKTEPLPTFLYNGDVTIDAVKVYHSITQSQVKWENYLLEPIYSCTPTIGTITINCEPNADFTKVDLMLRVYAHHYGFKKEEYVTFTFQLFDLLKPEI